MRRQRLVEIECIDDAIELLKHVRDNHETEHDEQGMELATVRQQRDELLAALEEFESVVQSLGWDAIGGKDSDLYINFYPLARAAIAKAKGGGE